MTTISTNDQELEDLMAELEAQNDEVMAAAKASEPVAVPAVEPGQVAATVIEAVVPEPEPAPVIEPEVVAPIAPVIALEIAVAELPVEAVKALEKNGTSLEGQEPVEKVTASVASGKPKTASPLQFYVDVDQFRTDTRITDATLDQCMIEQNGLRAFYGAEAARAEAQSARTKARFEVMEATLYDHHRKQLALTGEKTTEKMVENAVKIDPRWLTQKNRVIEADTIAAINKSLVESLRDRVSMMMQLGADRRDEMKGASRIMAEQSDRADLHSRAKDAMNRVAA